jgi:type II secretory pathway pseudopilin PulG
MSPLKARNAADTSRAGMTPVEIVVVVAILLVLTSVLSFGIYNIYEDSKRQVATLDAMSPGHLCLTLTNRCQPNDSPTRPSPPWNDPCTKASRLRPSPPVHG